MNGCTSSPCELVCMSACVPSFFFTSCPVVFGQINGSSVPRCTLLLLWDLYSSFWFWSLRLCLHVFFLQPNVPKAQNLISYSYPCGDIQFSVTHQSRSVYMLISSNVFLPSHAVKTIIPVVTHTHTHTRSLGFTHHLFSSHVGMCEWWAAASLSLSETGSCLC